MYYQELINKVKEIAKNNDNKIKITDIENLCDTKSDEYFDLFLDLENLGIEIIFDLNEDKNQEIKHENDNTNIYLKEIGEIKLLTKTEEKELAKLMEKGKLASMKIDELKDNIDKDLYDNLIIDIENGLDAKNKLVSSNLRLSVYIAKKYVGRGLLFQDLIQAGNMGLLKASDKFDYRLGYSFTTYASFWIRQSIIRSIVDYGRTIRIPNHINDLLIRFNKEKREFIALNGKNPTVEDLALKLNLDQNKVIELMDLFKGTESLDKEVGDDGEAILGEIIPSNDRDPFEYTFYKKRNEEINRALSILDIKEIEMLKRRYGLDGYESLTLEELGKMYGISKEAVRQKLNRIKRKIRESKYGEVLKGLWETLNNEED